MASGGLTASSSVFHGAQSTTISGGEINSSAGDHNRLVNVFNIYQGTQPGSGNQPTLIPGSQNISAPSGDSEQGPSSPPLNPGTQPHTSVTRSPEAHASAEEEETPNARYERHLLLKRHGFPLWAPQPHNRLPLSYRRKGVSIGDLGIITRKGYFDFLFNICLRRGHPSNPASLPVNFSPVHLLPADTSELREHDSGSCLLTSSTEKLKGLSFKRNGPEGSILVMPTGAYHEELLNLHKFKKTASQNAENWYRYAIGACGREVENGELRLVTGCDKTSLWGIATYSDIRPGTLTLAANSAQSPVEYTWDYDGGVEAKAGPKLDELLQAAGNQEDPWDIRNQCTFLRAYTITLSDDVWKTMVSTLVRDSSDNYILNSPEPRSYFPSIVSGLFWGFGGGGGPVNVKNHSLGSEKSTIHPATVINQMLLTQYPNAKVAISHDNDWCAVIREDEITMPDASELLSRIQKTFMFHFDEDGTVCLSQEHAPEANPERQSIPRDSLVTIPEYSTCARGTLSDGTDNAHNEVAKLSASARRKQSGVAHSRVSSEEGSASDDEVFVRTLKIGADDQDNLPNPLLKLDYDFMRHGPDIPQPVTVHDRGSTHRVADIVPSSFLKLADALASGSMITTHIAKDNLDWLDMNIKQLHKAVEGYPDLQAHCALVQNSLFPRLYVYTHACLGFQPPGLSKLILTNEYSKWIALDEVNRWAQFQTIQSFLWGTLEKCSDSCSSEIQTKAKEIIELDLRAVAAQIVVNFSIRQRRKALLDSKQPRQVHQGIINLLQQLVDSQDLRPLRITLVKALLDLSRTSRLYPSCLLLKGVEVTSTDYIGGGDFGNIWKGQLRGQAVAIKVVRGWSVESAVKLFSREATLWRQFHHPNVLPFFGVFSWHKGSEQQISLISPWMENGNLIQYLQRHPTADRMPFILDISLGLEYLHAFTPAVVHGDLKGTNILITPSCRACVANFGISTLALGGPMLEVTPTTSDSRLFLAPELMGPQGVAKTSDYLKPNELLFEEIDPRVQTCWKILSSDIYSFGCVCYEVYTGYPRFFRLLLIDAMAAALQNRQVEKPAAMTETIWSLVQSCWQVDPKKRPKIGAITSSLRVYDTGKMASPGPDHFNLTSPLASPRTSDVPITTYIDPRENHESTSSSLPSSHSATQPTMRIPDYPFAIPPRVPDNDLRLREKDIIIALMGPSGTGKSSFINKLMAQSVAYVNDSVDLCTKEVQAFACLHPDGTGRKIVLIDIPSFGDTGRTAFDILYTIIHWLTKTYKQGIKLTGIIHLYSIADTMTQGKPLKNLKMVEGLCGSDWLTNVILATTFWSQVPPDVGFKREEQLKSEFWAEMIEHGCRVARFDPWSYETAWKIIDLFDVAAPRRALKVQRELVDEKKTFMETSAFEAVAKRWDRIAEKLRAKLTKEGAHAKRPQGALKKSDLSLSRSESSTDLK